MRVSIITGGGAGIGAAVARALSAPGQRLMLHGQGADDAGRARLAAVAAACRQAGADVAFHCSDLATVGAASDLVDATRERFGQVDALVHAAGFADRRGFRDLPRDGLDRAYAVIAAAFHEHNHGRVVAISSFGAHRFVADGTFPASAAAKAALEALVRCLAIELAPAGGTANIVSPGYTRKDPGRLGSLDPAAWQVAAKANPLQRLAEPDDIAASVKFLLSAEARHITGAVLPVDGGLTLG
jgi:3-oxoacyl-[acyl-carrier protein] reductase